MPMNPNLSGSSSGFGGYRRSTVKTGNPFDHRNKLKRILGYLSAGQQALAGAAIEARRRKEGMRPRSMAGEMLRAIREQRSFTELTGNTASGIFLDFVVDPMNLVPFGAIPEVAKATGVLKGIHKLDEVTEGFSAIRKLKVGAIKTFGGPGGYLARQNPEKFFQAQTDLINGIEGVAPRMAQEFHETMIKAVPDAERRSQLFLLLGNRPLSPAQIERLGLAGSEIPLERIAEWQRGFDALSKEEKVAYKLGRKALDDIEIRRLRTHTLEKEQAAGFIQKFGTNYVPFRVGSKKYAIERMKQLLSAIEEGDPASKAYDANRLREQLSVLEKVPEVVTFDDQKILRDFYGGRLGFKPAFTKARKTGSAEEALGLINTDVATVLSSEYLTTARLTNTIEYVQDMARMADDLGVSVSRDLTKEERARYLVDKLGVEEGTKRVREGLKPIRDASKLPKEVREIFKDKLYPASIADEIGRTVAKYSDPTTIETFFKNYEKVQNFWKAWTLSIFPAYHARNVISNIWNNMLAGMDMFSANPAENIRVLNDYKIGARILNAAKAGGLDNKTISLAGKTERELWRAAMDHRVIRAGQFTGELGAYMNHTFNKTNFLDWKKLITLNPRTNAFSQFGYAVGTYLEDHARMSHFLWRLRKGDTVAEAASSVQKFLFDYAYGLSDIEQKAFRGFLMPFYAWTRFNLPLQLEMLVQAPRKINRAGKVFRAVEDQFGGPDPQEMFMADWMKKGYFVRWRYNPKTKSYEYFALDSWWPTADLELGLSGSALFEELQNLFTPFPKTLYEIFSNHSIFTNRDIREFPGQKKKLIGVSLPAKLDYVARQVRLLNEIDRTVKDIDRNGWVRGIGLRLVGLKSYPVDYARQKKWWIYQMRVRKQELNRQLKYAKKNKNKGNEKRLQDLIYRVNKSVEEMK